MRSEKIWLIISIIMATILAVLVVVTVIRDKSTREIETKSTKTVQIINN